MKISSVALGRIQSVITEVLASQIFKQAHQRSFLVIRSQEKFHETDILKYDMSKMMSQSCCQS